MAAEADSEDYIKDYCVNIVYINMETGEPIEKIFHWTITKYNEVLDCIGRINKIRYGTGKSSSANVKTIGR